VPGAGLEPARGFPRGILSPLRLPISPPGHQKGWGRNRTGVNGFAGRCITTLPPSHTSKKWSGKRDSNSRPQPWQGCALPLSYSRINLHFWSILARLHLSQDTLPIFTLSVH
jgi:hypothetical protein